MIDNGFHMASTCSNCAGSGTTIPRGSHCGTCAGSGVLRVRKTVKVDIPPGKESLFELRETTPTPLFSGVEDGMTVRIASAGDAPVSGNGSSGDLLVRINVASSKVFRRQGSNIHYDARIPLHTAVLGGRVRVPTLDGDVDVRVPGGTQQGEEMVLKERGIPSVYGGGKGDLFVAFSVQLPRCVAVIETATLYSFM